MFCRIVTISSRSEAVGLRVNVKDEVGEIEGGDTEKSARGASGGLARAASGGELQTASQLPSSPRDV